MTSAQPQPQTARRQSPEPFHALPGAFLAAYVAAAKSVELEPYRHLRQMRLPTNHFDSDDFVVPRSRFLELLRTAALLAERPDFALCVVRELSLAGLGPAGLLLAAQPTLRAALETICEQTRRQHWLTRAALEVRSDVAVLRFAPKNGEAPSRVTSELVVGFVVRLVQGVVGERWRPQSTAFRMSAPQDASPHEELFGDVVFGQPFDELRLAPSELSQPIPTANPALARLAAHFLGEGRPAAAMSFADEVRELVDVLLPHGLCTIEHVAERLGVDRRTVHRRLAEHGLTFSAMLQAARVEVVEAQLKGGGWSIGRLAEALGFSGPSTFSRWFRQTYGASASQVRKVG